MFMGNALHLLFPNLPSLSERSLFTLTPVPPQSPMLPLIAGHRAVQIKTTLPNRPCSWLWQKDINSSVAWKLWKVPAKSTARGFWLLFASPTYYSFTFLLLWTNTLQLVAKTTMIYYFFVILRVGNLVVSSAGLTQRPARPQDLRWPRCHVWQLGLLSSLWGVSFYRKLDGLYHNKVMSGF